MSLAFGESASLTGNTASRPAASADTIGRTYADTQTGILYRDNGTTWDVISASTQLQPASPLALGYMSGVAQPWGPIWPLTPIPAAGWSWFNQGSAQLITSYNAPILYTPGTTSSPAVRGYIRTAPATPYTITAAFLFMPTFAGLPGSYDPQAGLVFRQSDNGKLATFGLRSLLGESSLVSQKWNAHNSYSADYFLMLIRNLSFFAQPCWLKIADTGANRTLSISGNGFTWQTLLTTTHADFLTPDQVGLYLRADGENSGGVELTLLSWLES
jgi:hypothetical protein